MNKKLFSRLLKFSKKCAKLQTKNFEKSSKYFSLIDVEVNKLKSAGIVFNLKCGNKIYPCPILVNDVDYFRPLFAMSTHAEIKEARSDDTHAVDFDVPLMTEIYAVTEGIVTAINSNSIEGGNNPVYAGKDNYIYLFNKDENRIFCYRHFEKFDNIKINDFIKKGTLLGRVGLTGYVVSPHLHFVIYNVNNNDEYILKSLSIEFINLFN